MTENNFGATKSFGVGAIVWDRTNIVESYPGVTLPLTFSFIQHAYSQVYPSFLRSIGVPEQFLCAYQDVFKNLLGHLMGRVYYRAENWYRLVRVLPLYQYNKQFFEAMWNPARAWGTSTGHEPLGITRRFIVGLCFFVRLVAAQWHIARFKKTFNRDLATYRDKDMSSMDTAALAGWYKWLEEHFFASWSVPIMNDFRVMVYHGILRKLLSTVTSGANDELTSGLLSSSRLVSYSNNALRAMEKIVQEIRAIPTLERAIVASEPGESYRLLTKSSLAPLVSSYLDLYGDRHPSELKLEATTLREQPELMAGIIRQILMAPPFLRTKKGVENSVKLLMQPYRGSHNWFAFSFMVVAVAFFARITRRALVEREELRLCRSMVFGLARGTFIEFGKRLSKAGQLNTSRDIFYLTRDEVLHWALTNVSTWQDTLPSRMEQFARFSVMSELPRRLHTLGDDLEHWVADSPTSEPSELILRGTPASGGTVRAPAVVMQEFDSSIDVQGKVLVTLQTDPGWTVIFPLLAGVITERGGMLSHAAIVSRELAMPSVLGIEGATAVIRTGDIVLLDGTAGTVSIERNA